MTLFERMEMKRLTSLIKEIEDKHESELTDSDRDSLREYAQALEVLTLTAESDSK